MKKAGIYIAIGALVVLGVTILAAKKSKSNRRKRKEEFDRLIAINNKNNETKKEVLKDQYDNATEDLKLTITSQKEGKFGYPYASNGYANIRTSPKVNNGYINNLKYKHNGANKKIGMILKQVPSVEYGDKKTWYLIKLEKGGEGYGREDAIQVRNI